MTITDLKPTVVWNCFHQITQIPRPSKKEGKIIAFLEKFAQDHKIEYKKDKVGNIIMSKPAAPGFEKKTKVIMQSHMDMVCEKNADVKHDFETEPIKTVVDGEWLRADGTTLGADNGIGVAAELALLISEDVKCGAIECLFTVDEETGLTGAKAVQPGFMTGDILLNLDSEDEGQIFMGCAGGKDTQAFFTYKPTPTNTDLAYFKINVDGLYGGHSGGDIHKGMGNANKVLVNLLYQIDKAHAFTLCSISGGNLRNAIPREAHAIIGIDRKAKESVCSLVNVYAADVEAELKSVDPGVKVTMKTTDRPEMAIDDETKVKVIYSMVACPHGVIGMSHEVEGLVETSTNLASVKMIGENQILIGTSQRSSINSRKEEIANQVAATFRLAGAEVKHGDGYPGWAPNTDSKILKVAKETYVKLFGKEPLIMAIHAGLECGLFLEKYPQLDMISFGPTLRDVHTPKERIEIKTVQLWWDHLVELLKNIPEK